MDDYSIPNSFDFDRHLSAITAHRNKRAANNNNKRYVLFMLDSSGSITSEQFTTMKDVLSDLLILFCGNIKFGVMSYGAKIERNICFKCDQSNRQWLKDAMQSIKYHKGSSTRSGDAIRCACEYMLTRNCGYYGEEDSITDVIVLTDGHSNSGENVCTAAKNISDGINVVSIGVGDNIDYDELECIEGDNNPSPHIFDVENFDGLNTLKTEVMNILMEERKICKSFEPI